MAERFHAHDVAMEMASALRATLEVLARQDRDLASQLRRAASSVVLNLAEGARRAGKDRLHFYRIAAGSAAETRSGLELAGAWGYVDPTSLEPVEILLDRVLAMLWRLTHGGGLTVAVGRDGGRGQTRARGRGRGPWPSFLALRATPETPAPPS